MSSSSPTQARTAATATSAPSQPPSTKPVDTLHSQYSKLYNALHPILLLAVVSSSFNFLVRDPVPTLLGVAPTVAVLQGIHCVLCLPSTGQAPPAVLKPGQKKKTARSGQDFGAKVVPAFLSLVLTAFLSTPVLFLTSILFGAPLTTHIPHTVLFALHLALLTTPQLFYIHGLDGLKWLQLASFQQAIDGSYGMTLGAFIGGWLGAIPIPLDWDREWQKWPVTITVGMYIGAVVGKVLGGWVLRGKRVKVA